jgi:hypothetical protein
MTHRKGSERAKAEREAVWFGVKALDAIKAGDAERAGALAMFAIRWAKRSLGSRR